MERFQGMGMVIARGLRQKAGLGLLAMAAMSLVACNALTGAGDLEVRDGDGAGAGGGGGPPKKVECTYPPEPYGLKMGSIITPNKFEGYVGDATEVSLVGVGDYYDCDGSKGINALLVDVSGTWCGACQQEASILNNKLKTTYGPLGIEVLTLMIEDADYKPATPEVALAWKQQYNLPTTVAADPNFAYATVAGSQTIGLPLSIILDTHTMQIVDVQQGYPFDEAKLMEIAQNNKGE